MAGTEDEEIRLAVERLADAQRQKEVEAVSGLLGYRSPVDEPVPPSVADVFRGLFFGFLGLFAFLLAVLMGDLAYAIHSGGRGFLLRHPDTPAARPPSVRRLLQCSVCLLELFCSEWHDGRSLAGNAARSNLRNPHDRRYCAHLR